MFTSYIKCMADRKVETRLVPAGERVTKIFDAVTVDETRERLLELRDVASLVRTNRLKSFFQTSLSLVFATGAVIELSKPILPLLASDLKPLNQYPVLSQISTAIENPIGIGLLAVIGASYMARNAYRNIRSSQTLAADLRRVQPPTTPPPTI